MSKDKKKPKEKKLWALDTAYFGTGKYTTSSYQAWMTIQLDAENKKITITIWSNAEDDIPRVKVKQYKTRKNIYKKYRYHLGVALTGCWKFYRFNWMKKTEEEKADEQKTSGTKPNKDTGIQTSDCCDSAGNNQKS